MIKIDKLSVSYHNRKVGTLSFDPKGQLSEPRCRQLIAQVADNCGHLVRYKKL